MTKHSGHEFHPFSRLKLPRLVILTGCCRSGKTSLGLLLGSMRHVEFVEEPWTALELPVMQRMGLIGRAAAADMMRAYVEELFNDTILLRAANFRRSDESSIWRRKSRAEIAHRLTALRSRADVIEYTKKNRSTLVLSLTQTAPCLDFLREAFPQAVVIHLVRQAVPVALAGDWKRRSLFMTDDQLESSLDNDLYYDFKPAGRRRTLAIPWWVPRRRVREFLALPERGRLLFYWLMMHQGGVEASEKRLPGRSAAYWRLKYESLAADPLAVTARIGRLTGARPTAKTRQLAKALRARPAGRFSPSDVSDIEPGLLGEVDRMQKLLGYPPVQSYNHHR